LSGSPALAPGRRRRRGQPVAETSFIRGVLAWPLFFVGGALMFAAFYISGESFD
jgi:hypothetical protein